MGTGFRHTPVLLEEAIELLDVRPGRRYCDATLGGGGHSRRILEASAPDGLLLAIDRDPAALSHCAVTLAAHGSRLTMRRGRFGELASILEASGFGPVDGLLVDLGVSSHQLDTASRGFSFSDGPLDMRMDPDLPMSARELIARSSEQQLADIIYNYGEERGSRRIARSVKHALARGQLDSTAHLRQAIHRALARGGPRGKIDPATRTFQALRIAVNDELGELERLLDQVCGALKPGGRAVIITFHSLEDRQVKLRFRELARPSADPTDPMGARPAPRMALLTRKPVTPSEQEIHDNPRARSAKLRAAELLS